MSHWGTCPPVVHVPQCTHESTPTVTNSHVSGARIEESKLCRGRLSIVADLLVAGERLTDVDVDTILKLTGTDEDLDGNIKYEGLSALISLRRTCLLSQIAVRIKLKLRAYRLHVYEHVLR